MYKKRVLVSILVVLTLVLSVVNTSAWVYPEPTPEDTQYEDFGPRIDRVLIKLYDSYTAEFTALEGHEIDLTDWHLTHEWKTRWDEPPYNEYIRKVSYGPEYGMRQLDINNNDTIAAQGGMPCVTREISMRQAIACLSDKTKIIADCVGGQAYPLYSLFGPGWTVYQHPEIVPGGSLEEMCYLYNCSRAREVLINDAIFRFMNGTSDYGVQSTYGDHLEWKPVETGVWEDVWLDFFIRDGDPQRFCAGEMIVAELEDCLGVYCAITYGDATAARSKVMGNKDFHLYTGGWGLGYDPDWAWYLYSIEWYWHPGMPFNYNHVNNAGFNYWSNILAHAKNESEAIEAAHLCAEALAEEANIVLLWEPEGTKAYHRTYVGPETPYHGKNWTHLVNASGHGIDSWWTFLNTYPEGYPWGDGENMTLRWGFRVLELELFNPMYSRWDYDFKVLGLIYDSLLYTNPHDPSEWLNYLTESYTVGTWVINATTGETGNWVNFVLNDTVYWSDGTPFTTADIEFSLHGAEELLDAKGCPDPPWWNTESVKNVTIHDFYNCTVYLNVENIYAWHAVGGSIMIPEHIWQPIINSNTTSCDDLQGWGPDLDPGMVGTGPFLFVEYVPVSHILLARNPRYFRLPLAHRTAPPLARFTPRTGKVLFAPLDVTFDASCSVSGWAAGEEYPITEYRWDWDNDGEWDNITTSPTITHNFDYPGYPVDVEVALEVYAPGCPAGTTGRITNIITLYSHDVAVIDVTPSKTVVGAGYSLPINVTVENRGSYPETFDVSLSYDGIIIQTIIVSNLAPLDTRTLNFTWDTTGVAWGDYAISASASVVPGETVIDDNTYVDGTVRVVSPVSIAEVISCNQVGDPEDIFELGTIAYFKVTINSTALEPQDTLITINVYDNASASIGVASFQGPIMPGVSAFIFGLPIPTSAFPGTATVYANAYTEWPHLGGVPHCPEMSASFEIINP